jgi:hypothetical protein
MNSFLKTVTKFISFLFILLLSSSSPVFADAVGAIGKIGGIPPSVFDLGGIVKSLILVALFAGALFFLFQIIIGGISWINSGGDPKSLESSRGRIMNAVIGLVIIVAAFGITVIVTSALGINIFSGAVINIGQ